jgi:uroporphyrinogen decarboxylase
VAERSAKALAKVDRLGRALHHQEPDRVPIWDNFWTGFIRRWRAELGLPSDADPNRYYDLDLLYCGPNLDPHIQQFEVLRQDDREQIVRTGFGATIRKVHDFPMPQFVGFDTDTIDKVNSFEFDSPWDERRYIAGGDDQINGVGDDVIVRNLPPFIERLTSLRTDFAVFGGVIEATEFMTRSLGQANTLLWMATDPDAIARLAERANAFYLDVARAQIEAARGMLDGLIIWGDVAYTGGMLFSPDYWRRYFKPGVKAMIELAHSHGLPVIYHGCGNVSRILGDFAEIKLDGYQPLEAKAGLDVVDLRRTMGHGLAFLGNNDVRLWEAGQLDEIRASILRKLNAAKGGGYVFGSDHSVTSDVSGQTYDYVIRTARQLGRYPLDLAEHDLPDLD